MLGEWVKVRCEVEQLHTGLKSHLSTVTKHPQPFLRLYYILLGWCYITPGGGTYPYLPEVILE